jgi:hypothetical protein
MSIATSETKLYFCGENTRKTPKGMADFLLDYCAKEGSNRINVGSGKCPFQRFGAKKKERSKALQSVRESWSDG